MVAHPFCCSFWKASLPSTAYPRSHLSFGNGAKAEMHRLVTESHEKNKPKLYEERIGGRLFLVVTHAFCSWMFRRHHQDVQTNIQRWLPAVSCRPIGESWGSGWKTLMVSMDNILRNEKHQKRSGLVVQFWNLSFYLQDIFGMDLK